MIARSGDTRHAARRGTTAAAVACLVVLLLAVALGYQAISPEWVREHNVGAGLELARNHWIDSAFEVLARNLPVIVLLYSGAATLGAGSIIPLIGVGVFVGATFRIGAEHASAGIVLDAVGPYVFLELAACVLAATAGLTPLVCTLFARAIGSEAPRESPIRTYVGFLPLSLLLLAAALLLAVTAAGVEAVVILAA